MLDSFRRQLTSWFVGLFLLLYFVGGMVIVFVFRSVLIAELDKQLQGLHSHLRPLVDAIVHQFVITLIISAPLFALTVWAIGHFFAARASRPIDQTMQLLRRFVADAGHEFNTPITVIEASIETLDDTLKEKGLSTEVLEVIRRASERMKDLSAKLMFLAKMENPESVSDIEPIDLTKELAPLKEEYATISAQKKIPVTWNMEPNVMAVGNAESLRSMLSNLIDNALSYTESGGSVTVNLAAQPNSVTLSVEDSGIGIPAESIDHLFERFYRVDKSRSRAVGGSGLGLSIVKAIVDNHHGTIRVESQPGVGTKFTIVLPA
jgi:signal transduction histidine kinase